VADPLVLILQLLGDGTDVFRLGAELRQRPHGLLPQRRIPVLQLPQPITGRLAAVLGLFLRLLSGER
jgi:hypothetical protein